MDEKDEGVLRYFAEGEERARIALDDLAMRNCSSLNAFEKAKLRLEVQVAKNKYLYMKKELEATIQLIADKF